MKISFRLIRAALLATALLASQIAQAAQLIVGQVAPLSGLDANQGMAYSAGMLMQFNKVNKAGGVNSHFFTLVRKDDGGRPADTVNATLTLLEENKPLVLAGFFGNRNITELVNSGMLGKEKIALIGYRTAEIRTEVPLLYNVRASLRDEINKLTKHLATMGITRLSLFYEEGSGAPALLGAADEAAQQARSKIISKASYRAGTVRVSEAVESLVKDGPQAIIMVVSGAAAASFIEQYRLVGGAAQLFAHSGADIEQLSRRLAEEQMQGLAIAQVTPSPYHIAGRLTKEFRDSASETKNLEVPVSYAMLEGYITAKVIVEAVRRQGGRLNA